MEGLVEETISISKEKFLEELHKGHPRKLLLASSSWEPVVILELSSDCTP